MAGTRAGWSHYGDQAPPVLWAARWEDGVTRFFIQKKVVCIGFYISLSVVHPLSLCPSSEVEALEAHRLHVRMSGDSLSPKRACALWTPQSKQQMQFLVSGCERDPQRIFLFGFSDSSWVSLQHTDPTPCFVKALHCPPPHLLMVWSGPSQLLDGTPFKLTAPISITLIPFLSFFHPSLSCPI